MTKHIIVKPGKDEIRLSLVAFWERDVSHQEADPAWVDDLFIAGDAAHPDKTYIVSETPGVLAAIRAGRLEKVGDAPGEPAVTWVAPGIEVDSTIITLPVADAPPDTAQMPPPVKGSKRG